VSLLAVLALAIGTADLARGRMLQAGRYAAPLGAGALAAVLAAGLASLSSGADQLLLLVVLVVLVGWVVLVDRALREPAGPARAGGAMAFLAVGIAVLVAFSGAAGPVGGPLADWLAWTALPRLPGADADRTLLLAGLLIVQLSTGNLLVRLALGWGGAPEPPGTARAADRLRGGRLLGPMERVFILGLGLAGQVTAAGIVIAAKGLIRWPELQAVRQGDTDPGIDAVTEYFLVGSFVSWLVALGSLALLRVS
jgi:hypothetical protein